MSQNRTDTGTYDPYDYAPVASLVAGTLAKSFPGVDRVHIYELLWRHLWADGHKVHDAADEPERLMAAWFKELGTAFCKLQRSQMTQYFYRPGDVRWLLGAYFEPRETWEQARVPDDARGRSAAVDMLSDIGRVLATLEPEDQLAIQYRHEGKFDAGGYDRAVRALVRGLNRQLPEDSSEEA